ncbi:hypothetical protein OsI_09576 [Oryza sativa Indica Group]|uniref:1,3-beta-glucan synthase n=1 Tax=Oryza sativa subsp. indica TaxID=39946 RepID=B8AFI9_ORYSI|nr:hypothetical protein OsI_09576 [Oryza sativa Indica Group]
MQSFYQHYYKKYIQALQNAADKADRAQLTKAYQTAAVLFEVLKAVNVSQKIEVDQAILETHNQVEEKKKLYLPYNILPLDPDSANQAIMRYPEIQAAFHALRNTRGLPWPKDHEKKPDADLLGWLQAMFGFQKDNVSNQREHLILLLANVHIRQIPKPDQQPKVSLLLNVHIGACVILVLDDRALDTVMKKLFKNYKRWCKYLGRKSSLWLPTIQQEVQQRKLLYMGLYLLIWGEAANLRFMPECLCYIYHHMAFELYGMLAGNVSPTTGENVKPAYGGDEEAFLKKVVTPIYKVIEKEAERSESSERSERSKTTKSKHSHWRNYDDLNEYFWSRDCFRLGWPMRADADFFKTPDYAYHDEVSGENRRVGSGQWMGKVNFVEIRSFWHIFRSFDRMWSFLILSLQAMIIIAWNGGTPSDIFDAGVFKQVLSIFITAAILKLGQAILDIILSWKARRSMSLAGKLRYILKLISAAAWVVILPVTYAYTWENPTGLARTIKSWLGDVLRRALERSNLESCNIHDVVVAGAKIPNILFLQPRLFVGRGMHEGAFSLFKYTMFWVLLLATKLIVSYYVEIRTLGMLRSRFESLPKAFNQRLIPSDSNKRRGIRAAFSSKPTKTPEDSKEEEKIAARFAQIWNLIITSFREEDLIDNREKDLLLVPYCKDRDMDIIQWPPFLLASKIPIALDMAADSEGKDRDLKKRVKSDPYFTYAIKECYASFKNIIYTLVVGAKERDVIQKIFAVVDDHIAQDTLIKELNMSNLPTLSKKFIELLELLQKNNKEDQVRLLESVHGGNNRRYEGITPLDQQDQLFTKAIDFPVKESHAWTEKIKRLHLLLTVKESAMDVPTNLDARRRISFFANSLFMDMPSAPKVRHMLPFSFSRNVKISRLHDSIIPLKSSWISKYFLFLGFLVDEWKHFLQRVDCNTEEELRETEQLEDELRLWASYRGQTLTRTVRGMMYYRQALVLQAFLDMARDEDLREGFRAADLLNDESPLLTQCKAIADMKFTYVVSCQQYGIQKRSGDHRAQDILRLMTTYPSLRVAYIDEVEEPSKDRNKKIEKVYYSALVKAAVTKPDDPGQKLDQMTVWTVYVFLYGRLYLVLSGLDEALATGKRFIHNEPLQVALASQSFVQLGFLMALPMMMEIGLERGFRTALSDFVLMQLQLASVFFTFSLGTKTHYYGTTLLHGGAEYRATGRGFVVFHAKFAENYRLYSRSHFVKGIELLILLIVYEIFGQSYRGAIAYIFITFSMWFMVVTWLFAPFLFNPSGFEWQKIVDDWTDWNKWISNRGGIGVPPEKSWESWWEKEQEPIKYSGKRGIVLEIVLALRFFIYQYGLVYHLNITKHTKSVLVYCLSWVVIFVILLVMKTVSVGRRKFSADFQLVFRLIKGLIFITFISIIIILIAIPHMTVQDIFVCILAFMPTGWGLLLVAQAIKPVIVRIGLWGSIKALARGYEIIMGLLLFTPIAFLAWFPFVSEFQTRMLFNQAFSRGLQISRILGGHKKDRATRNKE